MTNQATAAVTALLLAVWDRLTEKQRRGILTRAGLTRAGLTRAGLDPDDDRTRAGCTVLP